MSQAVVGTTLDFIDIFSIISSVFSIVLGVLAIFLSIVFYRMSDKSSRDSEKSASNIEASVKKLEILFDKLYSGTFDMMKETVTDMRKYVYSNDDVQMANSEKLSKEIYERTMAEVAATISEIKLNQKSEEEIQKLIMDVVVSSKQTEKDVMVSMVREEIISYLRVNGKATYPDIRQYLEHKGTIINKDISLFDELKKLAEEGVINNPFTYDEEEKDMIIYHSSKIYLM